MSLATSAILVLLSCSPDSQHCREIRHDEAYASIEACRIALPETLRKLSQAGQPVIGRCVSAEGREDVDPITTGSVDADQYTTVRVTRIEDGRPSVSAYRVPKSAR